MRKHAMSSSIFRYGLRHDPFTALEKKKSARKPLKQQLISPKTAHETARLERLRLIQLKSGDRNGITRANPRQSRKRQAESRPQDGHRQADLQPQRNPARSNQHADRHT